MQVFAIEAVWGERKNVLSLHRRPESAERRLQEYSDIKHRVDNPPEDLRVVPMTVED